MTKVETAFNLINGRTLYVDMRPELLPREGEMVQFTGDNTRGFPEDPFTVTSVCRTYDADTGELTFVFVALDPAAKE